MKNNEERQEGQRSLFGSMALHVNQRLTFWHLKIRILRMQPSVLAHRPSRSVLHPKRRGASKHSSKRYANLTDWKAPFINNYLFFFVSCTRWSNMKYSKKKLSFPNGDIAISQNYIEMLIFFFGQFKSLVSTHLLPSNWQQLNLKNYWQMNYRFIHDQKVIGPLYS